ncbi:MAG: type IV pilus twitching motility protein PilT [Alphaproteobacteria bacterium]|nr:type IV pilus twitching motility protein PilT [Alphaproteobacteria bacterium]OJV17125.1 MAG: twitching motility protein PilT [Alphaproteobacteria bacterium 33-17]
MNLRDLVESAKTQQASDIHLAVNHPPMFRIHGEMHFLKLPAVTQQDMETMLNSIMSDEHKKKFQEEWELDMAYSYNEDTRFRINAFRDTNGYGAVLRIIQAKVKTLSMLKAPSVLERIAGLHKGIVLVTGPTGSGKSTTVAALIHHINSIYPKHIITVEDPIEFLHKSNKSLINQREVGEHTRAFSKALKSALREDPDIIMVGELRDLETIRLAMTAAETGHLVIGTLHTSSAPQSIDRIIDVFPPEEKAMIRVMLSNSLEAIITQQLIRTADKAGRVAAYEVLIANSGVRNLIREGKIPQIFSMMQVGSSLGMMLMRDSVMNLVNNGIITKEDAQRAMNQGEENTEKAKMERATTIF